MADAKILEVEKKVLSYLLHDKKYIAKSMTLNKQLFPNYEFVFSIVVSYYNNFKDIITDDMMKRMFVKKNIDKNTIIIYESLIIELKSYTNFNDGEFDALINELKENHKRNKLVDLADIIINTNPITCSSKLLGQLESEMKKTIVQITNNDSNIRKEGSIRNSIKDRFEKYKTIKENPDALVVYPTGFKNIDEKNGGFMPGELVYIIGRKGDGKSVLLLNLGFNLWEQGKNVIIFSIEISKEDYERRFDSRAAGVSSNGIKFGKLSDAEEKIYEQYLKNQAKGLSLEGKKTGELYIVDVPSNCTPAFIESKMEEAEQLLNVKFDIVITDYAGIMTPNIMVPEKRHQQSQIAWDQKQIARRKECVVISAAQKNRAGVGQKDSDSAFIAESDAVADHIDVGIDIQSVSDEYGVIQSFKTRDGEPFKFTFKKKYNCLTIKELDSNLDAWDQLK